MSFLKKHSIYYIASMGSWNEDKSPLILPSKEVFQVATMLSVIFVATLEYTWLPVGIHQSSG